MFIQCNCTVCVDTCTVPTAYTHSLFGTFNTSLLLNTHLFSWRHEMAHISCKASKLLVKFAFVCTFVQGFRLVDHLMDSFRLSWLKDVTTRGVRHSEDKECFYFICHCRISCPWEQPAVSLSITLYKLPQQTQSTSVASGGSCVGEFCLYPTLTTFPSQTQQSKNYEQTVHK